MSLEKHDFRVKIDQVQYCAVWAGEVVVKDMTVRFFVALYGSCSAALNFTEQGGMLARAQREFNRGRFYSGTEDCDFTSAKCVG